MTRLHRRQRLHTPPTKPAAARVEHTLRQLIEENAGIPGTTIRHDSTIDGDLAMDSLSFVSLQVAVEETFGIKCDPEDLEALNRFDAIASFIHENIDATNGASVSNRPSADARRPANGGARQRPQGRSRRSSARSRARR